MTFWVLRNACIPWEWGYYRSWWCPGGCFTNVLRALQNSLAKIYNTRKHIFGENFKLKLCACAQSMALGTRTKFKFEILIRSMIPAIHNFRENILESSRNIIETTPWFLMSPGQKQNLYQPCRICRFLFSIWKDINCLCHLSAEKWEMWIYFRVSSEQSSMQRVNFEKFLFSSHGGDPAAQSWPDDNRTCGKTTVFSRPTVLVTTHCYTGLEGTYVETMTGKNSMTLCRTNIEWKYVKSKLTRVAKSTKSGCIQESISKTVAQYIRVEPPLDNGSEKV